MVPVATRAATSERRPILAQCCSGWFGTKGCARRGIMSDRAIWEFLALKQRALAKSLKQKWAEVLIIVIAFPTLLLLLKLSWDMAELETRLAAFVNAMPELRRGIAAAAINQPFRSVLIVSRPIAVGKSWEAQVEVLDAENGDITTYVAELEEAAKQMLQVNLIGSIKRLDSNALSFREMQEKESVAGAGGEDPPEAIDGDASFVSYKDAEEIKSALDIFGFQKRDVNPATGMETWPTLKQALNRWHHAKGG